MQALNGTFLRLTAHPGSDYQRLMQTKTLTLTQLALHIEWPKRTIYNQLKDGRFPVDPLPRTKPRRWSVEAVDAWLAGRE